MKLFMDLKLSYSATVLCAAMLSACGGGSEGGANFILGTGVSTSEQTGTISIGIADAPVDDVKEVVILLDSITLEKSGEDDVVIDTFTSTELGITDEDTVPIDLLLYQDGSQAIVIEDLEVTAGTYTNIVLSILDDDINNSYVIEEDDDQLELNVPAGSIELGEFTVDNDGDQTFTIKFGLRQAMTYDESSLVYELKSNGIRLQDNDGDRSISGSVDSSLFDTESPCDEKDDATTGNVMYLYEGHDLNTGDLADVFDAESGDLTTTIPDGAIEPFAAKAVKDDGDDGWEYEFSFLPAGEYTLVFSCDAADDDPVEYDGLTLPFPTDQLVEVDTTVSSIGCDFPVEDGICP